MKQKKQIGFKKSFLKLIYFLSFGSHEGNGSIKRGRSFLFLASLILILPLLPACELKPSSEQETIHFAVATHSLSAPIYIAQEKGFFEDEGVNVELEQYWAGRDALVAVMSGKAQFCTVTETPIMFSGLKGEPISIIATIADSNKYMKIVARRDRGIDLPRDLRNKKIAIAGRTNAEYFLHAYLTFNGISKKDVFMAPLPLEKMTDALNEGTIDAAVIWNPHANRQQKLLGANGITFSNEKIYKLYWNIAAPYQYVNSHPDTVEKLLRALLNALSYMEEYPDAAKKITDQYVGAGSDDLSDFNFDMRLEQTLLIDMEDQARWAIETGLIEKREVPNFLRLLYFPGIETVAPDSVTVIHE